jgi:putative phosphoribosyl transferase
VRVVAAVPVACAEATVELRREVDELVVLVTPETFGTVSDWYEDFSPVADADVLRILGRSSGVEPEPQAPTGHDAPDESTVAVPAAGCMLDGDLGLPEIGPCGLVILAHGGGSSRHSYRNRYLAGRLRLSGFATLRLDLLTDAERAADVADAAVRFEVTRIARRLIAAAEWAAGERLPGSERIILMGASTGAAAALVAAAERPALVAAVVARGGRVDLAGESLTSVTTPVLLIVGGADRETLAWNRQAMRRIPGRSRLAVVPGAGHVFEEPGALGVVGEETVRWLDHSVSAML